MTYLQTAHYTLDRADYTGSLLLQNRHTRAFILFQGDDVTILEAELEHCPARLLDVVLSQYEEVLR